MIELCRHIEKLLLCNDCVIVPGLGGFIAQYSPAKYLSEEGIFLPPSRNIVFNERLHLNDGLIVQSYMEVTGLNYSQAFHRMKTDVCEIKNQLTQTSEYPLGSLGTLSLNQIGTIKFTPTENGVMTPYLYGLDSLMLNFVNHSDRAPQSKVSRPSINKIIKLQKEVFKYTAACILAIITYFAWATPLSEVADFSKIQTASVFSLPNQTLQNCAESKLNNDCSTLEDDVQIKNANINSLGYAIVLASMVPLRNAQVFVDTLKAKGFNSAQVYTKNNIVRVILGGFETENEAHREIRKQQKADNIDFNGAWVIMLK